MIQIQKLKEQSQLILSDIYGPNLTQQITQIISFQFYYCNELVYSEEDKQDKVFIILNGSINVLIKDFGEWTVVNSLQQGQLFGQNLDILGCNQRCKLVSKTNCLFGVLTQSHYERILGQYYEDKNQAIKTNLSKIKQFTNLEHMILPYLMVNEYSFRQYVYKEEQFNNQYIYLIVQGRFMLNRKGYQVVEIQSDIIFGDYELIHQKQALFTIQCNSQKGVLYLISYATLTMIQKLTYNNYTVHGLLQESQSKIQVWFSLYLKQIELQKKLKDKKLKEENKIERVNQKLIQSQQSSQDIVYVRCGKKGMQNYRWPIIYLYI